VGGKIGIATLGIEQFECPFVVVTDWPRDVIEHLVYVRV
jgi:hypothetical protein